MALRRLRWPARTALLICVNACAIAGANGEEDLTPRSSLITLAPGQSTQRRLGDYQAGQTVRLLLSFEGTMPGAADRVSAVLSGPGMKGIGKDLHAGDTDWFFICRPVCEGPLTLSLTRANARGVAGLSVRVQWRLLTLTQPERLAIEAEPNDRWQEANTIRLGRDVYGTADDVDYLANTDEGKLGLDWFKFEVESRQPILVYFQLDLLDRDVSANLRVFAVDSQSGKPLPYQSGKDPMEIVHDRERERYSKHISRTFTKGEYYLEVNANHPDYILRTRVLPIPPYSDPAQAVEAGMHYIMNVGDAWFAQVPRGGNIFVRSENIHDTATRCTACHAATFSTEANLAAHRSGYSIRSKSNFQYVMERIANSVTPMYGDAGLYWQRFIATPLEAQGEQGAVLAEFERDVSGRRSPLVERFGRFLRAAWESRRDLPPDEQNAVVPMDSKFSLAWRDWLVLNEVAERTGDAAYARAAANIARIVGERAADKRSENLQDRINRLKAWWLIDRNRFASKLKRETGALLALQNSDGGWHESDAGPGPSAVYVTGQIVDTMLEIGLPRDHPAMVRALRYLLATQQDFGGWFQTTTHENFRTPMRETRYAVMALARAYPRAEAPWSLGAIAMRVLRGCRVPVPWWKNWMISRICGMCPCPIDRDSPEKLPVCWMIPSRSSGPRPRPVWVGWDSLQPPLRWPVLCATPQRSSGGRRPGRCGVWATRELVLMRSGRP